jgi:hypothetical protein
MCCPRLGIESSDADQAAIRVDNVQLLRFITNGVQTSSVSRFFATSAGNAAGSLPDVHAAIKEASSTLFEAPACAVATSLVFHSTISCGAGTFLSFQRSSGDVELLAWSSKPHGSAERMAIQHLSIAGTLSAVLCCPEGCTIVDAQFYKDMQLVALLALPGDEYRLEIVDCCRLEFKHAGGFEGAHNFCVVACEPTTGVLTPTHGRRARFDHWL